MKKTALAVALIAIAASAFAQQSFNDTAMVTSVVPNRIVTNQPSQSCQDVQVQGGSSDRGYAGSIVGGIAGALLGSQIGGGSGKNVATAVGAVAGSMTGDRVQNDQSAGNRTERRCNTVNNQIEQNNGFKVAYLYNDHRYTTVMQSAPGSTIEVAVSVTPTGR